VQDILGSDSGVGEDSRLLGRDCVIGLAIPCYEDCGALKTSGMSNQAIQCQIPEGMN
jgi:hypothetical protein